jgi:acyl-CoA dehydrogenase
MSETITLLTDATQRALAQHLDDATMRAARAGAWPQAAWDAVVEQGLPLALVAGEQGFDVPLAEGLGLLRLIGRHAAPLPLAETMIGNLVLARAGLPVSTGPLALVTIASGLHLIRDGDGWVATGKAERVAWGRHAAALVIEDQGAVAHMAAGFETIAEGSNLAHMPRDTIAASGPVTWRELRGPGLTEAAALARALMMAGALDRLVELTIAHVSERQQFGRALSAFQAVQHSLARLASEAAAAGAAADLAARAFAEDSPMAEAAIAAARARIGEAAGVAIGLAHQLHGAIGVTEEHRLHWFTTALWSWRDEYGTQAWWTRRLGAIALDETGATFWPFITAV